MSDERIRQLARELRIERGWTQASAADLDFLHEQTGLQHSGLDALLSELDGSNFVEVLPQHDFLLPAREIAAQWAMYMEIEARTAGVSAMLHSDAETAGSNSLCWSRYFLPLTNDGCGDGWIIDLRPGYLQGAVFQWSNVDGVNPELDSYENLAHMLEDLGDYKVV
jgi:hypothetical protein